MPIKSKIVVFASLIILAGCPWISSSSADSVVLNPSSDNAIYADNTGNSNGSGDFVFAGNNGGGSSRRSLIQFDLSAIPDNAIIENATVTLFMSQSGAGDTDVSFHRLLSSWGESSSDAPGGEGGGTAAAIGDATWSHTFFDDQFWANAGGDFLGSASATSIVGGVGNYSWTSATLIADVQNWLDGTALNAGWAIVGDESTSSTSKRFNSRSNGANVPILTVEFTTVPEPSALVCITAIWASVLIRRRRN